jgi:hypothetical protein
MFFNPNYDEIREDMAVLKFICGENEKVFKKRIKSVVFLPKTPDISPKKRNPFAIFNPYH